MELTRTQTDNQMEQPGTEPARIEVRGNTLNDDVTTVPSTHQQLSQVDTRLSDRGTNTSEVESRTQREETRINILSSDNNRDVQMLTSYDGVSSCEADIIRGSPMRIHTTDIIPQIDGPTSVCMRRRFEQEPIQRTTMLPGGGYPDVSDSDSQDNRRPCNRWRPSGRRRYQGRSGRPPDRGNSHDRGYSRRGGPPDDGGPLMMEDPLMMENPLMMEDPLIMEDPIGMEEIQDVLEDKDLQAHQDLLDQ